MRLEFELTEQELKDLLQAMTPNPVMYLSGGNPMFPSRQELANRAWERLADKLGFLPMTVKSVPGKGPRFFTAVIREGVITKGRVNE